MTPIIGTIASSIQAGGSFESISSTLLTTSSSQINFDNIPQTYKHLQLRILTKFSGSSGVDGAMLGQFNGDTATNYSRHYFVGYAGGTSTHGYEKLDANPAPNWGFDFLPSPTDAANLYGLVITDIYDYANTNKFKMVKSVSGYARNDTNNYCYWGTFSSGWRNTNAVTSIQLKPYYPATQSFATNSRFSLYGIKDAI